MATSVAVLELALFQQFNVSADIHEGMCDVSPLPAASSLVGRALILDRGIIARRIHHISEHPSALNKGGGGVGGCHRVACKSRCLKTLETPALAFLS